MLRDDKMYPAPTRIQRDDLLESDSAQETHANDILDDVFGSAPGSPAFYDDEVDREGAGGNEEYSDIPRLRVKHETEGYRDGVTQGKAETVQAGFDEGYRLGAVLGLRVGRIVGLLDGLVNAISTALKGDESSEVLMVVSESLRGLAEDARRELRTESVFGREWWSEDGNWKFEVPGEGQEGFEMVFPDVASAHPLIRKWEAVIDTEVRKWRLDLSIMDTEDTEGETQEKETSQVVDAPALKTGIPKNKELIW
jgi:hypothetical protein